MAGTDNDSSVGAPLLPNGPNWDGEIAKLREESGGASLDNIPMNRIAEVRAKVESGVQQKIDVLSLKYGGEDQIPLEDLLVVFGINIGKERAG